MGRQYRGPRSAGNVGGGHYREFVGPTPGSSVAQANLGHAHTIPNYGVTDISTWAASTYYMAPPEQGVMKTIVSYSTGGVVRYVALSTTNSVAGGTIGGGVTTANSHIRFASTLVCSITLIGVNSTQWAVVSCHPTTNSTGTNFQTT